jgi:organic hydroperoxide reductase OsmC/OhrA
MSTYTAKIFWKSDSPETFTKNRYTRGHTWEFDGGVSVPASSSPHVVRLPFSIEAAVDPEEALVAAASSCHMLTFLWLAAKAGFNIAAYTDNAVGEMTKGEDGKEWVSLITLDPQIEWTGERIPTAEELAELHHAAHEGCYIANSIKSEVVVAGTERTTPSAEAAATPPS